MNLKKVLSPLLLCGILLATASFTYPIDGYLLTGIRRLLRLERVEKGEIKETTYPLPAGAKKLVADIHLNLLHTPYGDSLQSVPAPDPALQKGLNAMFPGLNESYSVTLMDITPGRTPRYAERQPARGFQPGSVGKLAVITGLFCELDNIYPNSFESRQELLKTKIVRAGKWALYDEHTVPFYDPESGKLVKRQVQLNDVFSLYEWADHMLSVSNNGAASVVWREALLMRVFGADYPTLTEETATAYFDTIPKAELSEIARSVVNDPLRDLGISEEEWRLGLMFTRGASDYVPGKGGSIGTPRGLMKWLLALERGAIVDSTSSLEIKRLMYMTDRRIRYASSSSLKEAAVYFKSGSLYKCQEEEGFACGKYMGNVFNYMNSVAIVEHPDSTVYLVALMSNVLRKNSNSDHSALSARIDRLVRSTP